jgi:hypothetical protein
MDEEKVAVAMGKVLFIGEILLLLFGAAFFGLVWYYDRQTWQAVLSILSTFGILIELSGATK